MSRIVLVLPNLSGGGAARVASILCGEWADCGHEVHLVTFEEPGAPSVYPLGAAILRHQIGLSVSPKGMLNFARSNAQRVRRLRATLRSIHPDVAIAFLLEANIVSVLASPGLGFPVLISERNHPAHHKMGGVKSALRRWIYPRAGRLCVQTDDIRRWFKETMGLDAAVIPNPVDLGRGDGLAGQPCRPAVPGRRRLISLGRLEPQKGYDRLIDAYAHLAERLPAWDLFIFGEGQSRGELEAQIDAAGLGERVFLPGATSAPVHELAAADLFVSASRFEGFPNALIEALAAGLCVVATDCPGATGDILGDGQFGLLAPDGTADELAEILHQAMANDDLRADFSTRAKNSVSRFAAAAIAKTWLDVADDCRAPSGTFSAKASRPIKAPQEDSSR